MVANNKHQILEAVDCDTARLYGPLDLAAKYLLEVKSKYPNATLEEHWTGYENMEMRFSWYRDETDNEMQDRLEQEAFAKKLADDQRRKDEEKATRRKQYLALKKEFG